MNWTTHFELLAKILNTLFSFSSFSCMSLQPCWYYWIRSLICPVYIAKSIHRPSRQACLHFMLLHYSINICTALMRLTCWWQKKGFVLLISKLGEPLSKTIKFSAEFPCTLSVIQVSNAAYAQPLIVWYNRYVFEILLTHLPLVPHICGNESGQQWFR